MAHNKQAQTPNAEQLQVEVGPEMIDGYTRVELDAMFTRLHQPGDWKAPIDATVRVDGRDMHVITKAVEFFTATIPTITVIAANRDGSSFVRVQAQGYRMGPAGDH